MKSRYTGALFAIATAFAQPACGPIIDTHNFEVEFQQAIAAIDTAIKAITSESSAWRGQLDQAYKQLISSGMTSAAAFVRNTISDGIAQTGIEYRCDVVYTSQQIKDSLIALKQGLLSGHKDAIPTTNTHIAYVCNTTPENILWKEAPSAVMFHGFDFDSKNMSAKVQDVTGIEHDISGSVTVNNTFMITVNLTRIGNGALFPRNCDNIYIYSSDQRVGSIACLIDCDPPPLPTIIPSDRRMRQNQTDKCESTTGCKIDRNFLMECSPGYTRAPKIEIQVTAGKGYRHCGDSEAQNPSAVGTYYISGNPSDCSFHAHAGVDTGWGNWVQCRWVVWEQRPEQRIENPAPKVGWCPWSAQ